MKLLVERGKTHGDYTENATIAQALKSAAEHKARHLSPSHRESLDLIFTKIGRILAGDPNTRDHWEDIAGYAMLAAERVE
jgi:hypothetical protein